MIENNELPKNWEIVSLEEISEGENAIVDGPFGSNLKTSDYIDDALNGVPVLTTKNLEGDYSENSVRYISKCKFEQLKRSQVNPGDIIVAKIGSIGKNGIYPKNARTAIIPANLLKFTVSKEINHSFVYLYLNYNGFQKKLKEISTATAQPAFNVTKFRKLEIAISPLQEQQRIVSKIEELSSKLDKGIESLKTAQQQLKVYRHAVVRGAFNKKNVIYLSYVLSDISERIQIGPFGTQLHKEDYIENGVPLINPMHIKDGKIVADTSYSITEAKRDSLSSYILQFDDIIMGRRGEMGRCGIVGERETGWLCGTGSLYIRLNKLLAYPKYVFNYLMSDSAVKYLNENAAGTTMTNLNRTIVNGIPIRLPSLFEQQRLVEEIESRLSVCDKIEETIEQSLKQAEALRQSILKKAFEGKLVPQDPNDEPASKLLERIRAAKEITEKLTTKNSKLKIQN